MTIAERNLTSIVIVGGGTAGWISAAVLSHVLQGANFKVTLIESPDIPTIGVGEATIPSFVDLLRFLRISELDFIEKTGATYKLGIKFVDWLKLGHHYWHPFGMVGSKIDGRDFYHYWLKNRIETGKFEFTDFSPAIALAKTNRFFIPDPARPTNLSKSAYALHFDASLTAAYFSEYAQGKGVRYISSNVDEVAQFPDGSISELKLQNGESISADFYIDCSGQRGLLIGKTLRVSYLDWQEYLPVNSAAVLQTETEGELQPFTESIAHEHGWRWRIPLQARTGNGYVFCKEFASDQDAIDLLVRNVKGSHVNTPRILRFNTGKRKKIWHKNCLAVGLSSGFLEPLESTSIYLAMKGILNFIQMFPNKRLDQVTIDEYNRLMDIEYECIRDFIVLHYCVTERRDSPFWRMWQYLAIPESLKTKLSLFKSQGRLMRNEKDLFASDSWYSVLEGMGVRPNGYDPLIDSSDFSKVKMILEDSFKALEASAARAPTHSEFIKRALNSRV